MSLRPWGEYASGVCQSSERPTGPGCGRSSPPDAGGRGVEPVEHPLCQDEDDAPRANLHAVAASMNERLRQLPVTWVQAKNKTAITR